MKEISYGLRLPEISFIRKMLILSFGGWFILYIILAVRPDRIKLFLGKVVSNPPTWLLIIDYVILIIDWLITWYWLRDIDYGVMITGYWLWGINYRVLIRDYWLHGIDYGVLIMGHSLWGVDYGILQGIDTGMLIIRYWLQGIDYGVLLMAYWLQEIEYGVLITGYWLWGY